MPTPASSSALINVGQAAGMDSEDLICLSCAFIQITLNEGRTLEAKQRFYRAVAKALAARPGIRTQDVLINLVEVAKENWSFGDGIAQYAPEEKA